LFGGTLPDLRDKFLMGAGATAIGTEGGAASVLLTAAQSGLPAHDHSIQARNTGGGSVSQAVSRAADTRTVVNLTGMNLNTAANAAQAHENRPPFRTVKWITRAG